MSIPLLEQLYQTRQERVTRVCSSNTELNNKRITRSEKKLISSHKPIVYCNIPKLASTFWKKILHPVLHQEISRPVNRPYANSSEVYRPFSFMFVRNPYERAMSGYIDKLFGPNVMFWKFGRYAINRYRKNATERSLMCGHDLTFREFIEYAVVAVKERHRGNIHFTPMYSQCSLCKVHYDVIGSFDTFTQDTHYILESILNKTGVDLSEKEDTDDSQRQRIINKIRNTFRTKEKIVRCMTFQEALERVWRNFQMRGLMDKGVRMPLSLDQSEQFNITQVTDIFLNKWGKSKSSRRSNKNEALAELFRQIPQKLLKQFTKVFSLDFELFGFDKRTNKMFDKKWNNTYKYLTLDYRTDGSVLL